MIEKMKKSQLGIKYRNLTHEHAKIVSIMENSENILRMGSRTVEAELAPK